MKRVGLIGNPVEHSRSPAMHNAAFRALGMNATYELWHTEATDIGERMRSLKDDAIVGANVTVPHKQAVMPYLDDISETARKIGAVNTIIPDGDRLVGDNTDAYGFAASVKEKHADFAPQTAIVLGAGGASRAVIVALQQMGAQRILLANRTLGKAEMLAEEFAIQAISWEALPEHLGGTNMLVNATSLGWHDEVVLPDEHLALLQKSALVFDLTYRSTPLLRAAASRGLQHLDGLGMLVHQGARSFELWFGIQPPIDVMRQAISSPAP